MLLSTFLLILVVCACRAKPPIDDPVRRDPLQRLDGAEIAANPAMRPEILVMASYVTMGTGGRPDLWGEGSVHLKALHFLSKGLQSEWSRCLQL